MRTARGRGEEGRGIAIRIEFANQRLAMGMGVSERAGAASLTHFTAIRAAPT
jgi:hypothetical protein